MSELAGMTVNERLFHLGLLDAFDSAVENADIPGMRRILTMTEIGDPNVREVIRSRFPALSEESLDQST